MERTQLNLSYHLIKRKGKSYNTSEKNRNYNPFKVATLTVYLMGADDFCEPKSTTIIPESRSKNGYITRDNSTEKKTDKGIPIAPAQKCTQGPARLGRSSSSQSFVDSMNPKYVAPVIIEPVKPGTTPLYRAEHNHQNKW
jgi:hypothetical protein